MTAWLAQAIDPSAQTSASQAATALLGLREVIAPYMGVFFVAFFVSILAVPIMRSLAIRNGIIDWPDLKRKAHIQPVAYLGGVGIFVGWLAGVLVCFFLVNDKPFPIQLIFGAAAITVTGVFDDVYGIRPRVKVGGQLFAAAALSSITFTNANGHAIGVQLIEACFKIIGLEHVTPLLVVTVGTLVIAVFVLGGCNAVNLIDGLDGLASGVTAIATAGFLVVAAIVAQRHIGAAGTADAMWASDTARIVICLALLGAICGFLPYNFNPATIFMGDAGSLLLGYLAVSIILLFADTQQAALKIVTACLIIFALPITDTSLAIIRRKIRGQPIFSPDSQHIHHLLRKRGLSVKKSVLVMYTVSLMFAALGVSMVAWNLEWRYVLAVFVVMYGFIMVTAFKYGQVLLIREKLREQERLEGRPTAAAPGVLNDDTPPVEAPLPGEYHAGKDPHHSKPTPPPTPDPSQPQ